MNKNERKINDFKYSRQPKELFITMDELLEFKAQFISEVRKLLKDLAGNAEKKMA